VAFLNQRLRIIKYDTDVFELTEKEIQKVSDAIYELKVLDPACGSGAFPMGILNKIMMVLDKFDPDSIDFVIKYLDTIKDKKARKEEHDRIYNKDWRYKHKLSIIRNSIYGVDIQPIAADISKLRFFLSLVVDETINDKEENRGVLPLPNLEFKFVCANSLIDAPEDKVEVNELFGVDPFFENLKDLVKLYFDSFNKKEKLKLREKIEKLIEDKVKEKDNAIKDFTNRLTHEKSKVKKEQEILNRLAYEIDLWDSYKNIFDNKPIGFFATKYFYPEIEEGFDIVIGNPPYVQIQKFSGQQCQKDWEVQGYETFEKTGDIYCLFYERGHQLLSQNGLLTFITSNKWMRANYGKATRKYFATRTNPILLVDFGGYKVFESATVDTNILMFENTKNQDKAIACAIKKDFSKEKSLEQYVDNNFIVLNDLSEESWIILTKEEFRIKRKIERIGTPLKNWDVQINYGIKTGFNEAFIIDAKTKDRLIKEDSNSAEIIKPILRGKDINKYKAEFADLWLIATHNGYKNSKGKSIPGIDVKKYSAVKKHLDTYWKEIKKRCDQGNTPYNLRSCAYMEEFEKEKIVYQEMVQEPSFAYDKDLNYFCVDTGRIITGKKIKFLNAIFNSKLFFYSIKNFYGGGALGGTGIRMKHTFFEYYPIPLSNQSKQKPFEDIVDIILKKKEKEQDTTEEENKIDIMVYKLYELDYDEVKIIDPEIEKVVSREEYGKFNG
jgi:adenine-specific DNA-methyltransferase